jgi:hypothetical protein
MANSTIISAHRHSLRLSFDIRKSAQPRSLDSGIIDFRYVTGRPRGSNHERNRLHLRVRLANQSILFAEGRTSMCSKNSHTLTALRKDLWLQYEITTPLQYFPARFLLLLAQSFTEHGRYALGVIVGDEGMYRRYEADFSYGLLGTWDNPTSSSVSVGADSIHGIWRWTLAGAASGVVGAMVPCSYRQVWSWTFFPLSCLF